MFPYPSVFEIAADLRVHHEVVINQIGPLLTESRVQKISKVVQGRCFDIAVVMEGIYDRGNLSAVMRTGEGLGFANFHVIETQHRFKEANRVTQGADKWVEVTKYKSTTAAIAELRRQGKRIVVTALNERAKPLRDIDFSVPTALVLGNEKIGASEEIIAAADDVVIIPMTGFVQSFNISVAGALCLYHILQDRQKRRGHNNDLSEEQKRILMAEYFMRTQDSAHDVLRRMADSSSSRA